MCEKTDMRLFHSAVNVLSYGSWLRQFVVWISKIKTIAVTAYKTWDTWPYCTMFRLKYKPSFIWNVLWSQEKTIFNERKYNPAEISWPLGSAPYALKRQWPTVKCLSRALSNSSLCEWIAWRLFPLLDILVCTVTTATLRLYPSMFQVQLQIW
jgi:hypothetical protein